MLLSTRPGIGCRGGVEHKTGMSLCRCHSQASLPGYGGGMSDDDKWTPHDVTSMIANPFYAINIDRLSGLSWRNRGRLQVGDEHDWLACNGGHRLEIVVVAQDDEALTFGGRGNEQIDGTC
jgi:hypothetical protein